MRSKCARVAGKVQALSAGQSKSLTWALWCNAVLLAAILCWLVVGNGPGGISLTTSAAWAQQAPQPIAGGAGLFLMPGQFSATTWGCYVMDVDRQVLLAYQYMPGDKTLRLVAARNFTHDRRLGNFNTEPPPLDIKSWADKEADNARVRPGDAPPPRPESPAGGEPR